MTLASYPPSKYHSSGNLTKILQICPWNESLSQSLDESRSSKPGTCYLLHMEPILRYHLHTILLSMHLVVQKDSCGVLLLVYPISWGSLMAIMCLLVMIFFALLMFFSSKSLTSKALQYSW